MEKNCVFCKLIKGEIPRKFIYEDDKVVAFNSNQPSAEVHILIVPKKHISTFMELDDEAPALIKVAQKLIKNKNLADGYRLCFNGGKYQEVPHIHLHLLAGKIDSYT
jgi:histidine triad (HIT) family protein